MIFCPGRNDISSICLFLKITRGGDNMTEKSLFGCMNFNRTIFDEHKEPWQPQWKKPVIKEPVYDCDDPRAPWDAYLDDPAYSNISGNIFHKAPIDD